MNTEHTNNTEHTEQINIILRQTDYDVPTAEQKLEQHNNNVMLVIREYLNHGKNNVITINSSSTHKISKNQQIYKEIRTFMDDAAKAYQDKKDNEKSN